MGGRAEETRAAVAFIESMATHPSVLVFEGEQGVGKSTVWLEALQEAHASGYRVMSARTGPNELGMSYAVLADLLDGVDPTVIEGLPALQRVAIEHVLLQGDGSQPGISDERKVAAAFLTIVERLAADTPVVVAIDDLQWLDPASRAVIAFSTSRFKGRIGVLVTERIEAGRDGALFWLRSSRLDGIERIRVKPLSLGGLRKMITSRLGRSYSRPTMVRIGELSGGNPFYALELARAMDGQSPAGDPLLPGSLSGPMRAQLESLGADTLTVLLAAACVGAPTVDLLARATGETTERVVDLLEVQEASGIVQIVGNRVQFTHPLLARGVYSIVRPVSRRQMHRALADIVEQPELRARHLALASTSADPDTLQALDTAALAARARGAPAAAAELIDLAINLGGDKPSRRIQAAEHHFRAGDSERAYALLEPTIDELPGGPLRASAMNLLAAMQIYDDNLTEAIELLNQALVEAEGDHVMLVRSLLLLSFAYFTSWQFADAVRQADEALERARDLSIPELTSQVLAMSVIANCLYGNGVDEMRLKRALELEDRDADIPLQFRASATKVITQAWTGQLDDARRGVLTLSKLCLDRGAETDMMAVATHRALIDLWRGDFAEAAAVADEAMDRAEQIGADNIRMIGLTIRAAVSAHLGLMEDARSDARAALDIAIDCGSTHFQIWSAAVLGFVEIPTANYAQALVYLGPLVENIDGLPGTEITIMGYVPDVAEALIGVGQIDAAMPLIERLEGDGRRLDRAWLLATGARCRGMALAAQGDLTAAMTAVDAAMAEHDRLPMPFERARTLLLLGQVQRRGRLKQLAAHTFGEALREFERMGATSWAARTREELERTNVGPPRKAILTPTELRIAELATSGLTNRDVAASLFISLKTVEANLTQIYKKLGIRSRAQLAQKLSSGEQ